MATITFGGNPANTSGSLPALGSTAPNFTLTAVDLSSKSLSDFGNSRKILNIFPSVGTGICAASVRRFNEAASKLNNTKVLCISKDLPFAQQQFCAAEGLEDVIMLSDYKNSNFIDEYGVLIMDSKFEGLLARAVVILNENNKIIYSELVPEIGQDPDFESALKSLS